jgi:hypothetical protein
MLATFIALGGTAYAASALPSNSVGTSQIKRDAVTLAKINPRARASLRAPKRPTGKAGGDLAGRYPNPRIKVGAITAKKLAALPPETPVTYNNHVFTPSSGEAWRNLGAPYEGAAYYRDEEGVVHLSGVSQSIQYNLAVPPPAQNLCANGGNGLTMFVLPAGDRPAGREIFAVDSNNSHGRVDVEPDGEVVCVFGAGDQYVSLNGISFRPGG